MCMHILHLRADTRISRSGSIFLLVQRGIRGAHLRVLSSVYRDEIFAPLIMVLREVRVFTLDLPRCLFLRIYSEVSTFDVPVDVSRVTCHVIT